jgi:hypothetical protein
MEDSPTLGLATEDLYLIQHVYAQTHDLNEPRGIRSKR